MKRLPPLLVAAVLAFAACDNADSGDPPSAATDAVAAADAAPPTPPSSAPPTPPSPAADAAPPAPPPAPQQEAPPPDPEALARADSLVAFANVADMTLASGKYAQADVLAAFVEYYLSEWQLPRRQRAEGGEAAQARRLIPPDGLFPPEQARRMVEAVRDMGKAVDRMRGLYDELAEYVEDAGIRDNGVRGRRLGRRILEERKDFLAARGQYLRLVGEHAGPAQELLLRGHPLARQIRASSAIFAVFSKAVPLLAAPRADPETLAPLEKDLRAAMAEAGRPPFMAPPAVERLFRAFLKAVGDYAQALAQGRSESFHNGVREALNDAALRSRAAYNGFVAAANASRGLAGAPGK